jgi:opacity protein-like surface antigen
MKRIFGVIAMTIIFCSAALLVNAQENKLLEINLSEQTTSYKDVEGVSSEDEWNKIVESAPLGTINKNGNPVLDKEKSAVSPKFSIAIGVGTIYSLGYKFKGERIKSEIGNSSVFMIRAGYSPWKNKICNKKLNIEFQIEYSKSGNLRNQETEIYSYTKYEYSNQVSFLSRMFNIKIASPLIMDDNLSLYIIGGIGKTTLETMFVEKEYEYGNLVYSNKQKSSSSGKHLKIGGGIDAKLQKNLFLFSEYSYQEIKLRTNNINYIIYYSQITGGVGLRF